MSVQVRAETLSVGDVVVLPTQHGARTLSIVQATRRTATIKFVGRTLDRLSESAGETHWGWTPDQAVELVRRSSQRGATDAVG